MTEDAMFYGYRADEEGTFDLATLDFVGPAARGGGRQDPGSQRGGLGRPLAMHVGIRLWVHRCRPCNVLGSGHIRDIHAKGLIFGNFSNHK